MSLPVIPHFLRLQVVMPRLDSIFTFTSTTSAVAKSGLLWSDDWVILGFLVSAYCCVGSRLKETLGVTLTSALDTSQWAGLSSAARIHISLMPIVSSNNIVF